MKSCSTGEFRDSARLTLPGVQEDLLETVVATGKTCGGFSQWAAMSSPWMVEHASAILEAWLPGEEGARAVVDAIFGRINWGKLPVSVLRHVGQVPLFYNHKPSGARSFPYGAYVDESNQSLFPFGFGLSYTHFKLSDLKLSTTELKSGESIDISLNVSNTGRV
ncbi:MAG: glycoside hydrolase family 3 C-terminal domain-containing protein [Deinococcales bacterium]